MSEQLRDLISRTAEDAPPHQFNLTATMRRGKVLRRRRVVARGVAACASLALLCGMGVAGINALTSPTVEVAAPPPSSTAPTPTAGPPLPSGSAEPESTLVELEVWTEAAIAALLKPYGSVSALTWGHARGESPNTNAPYRESTVSGTISLTDADGTTGVRVMVWRTGDPNNPDDRRERQPQNCEEVRLGSCQVLADGSILESRSGAGGFEESDPRYVGEQVNAVTLHRSDRVSITLIAYNGPGEKLGKTRERPALTLEQLTTLVTDPRWDNAPVPG